MCGDWEALGWQHTHALKRTHGCVSIALEEHIVRWVGVLGLQQPLTSSHYKSQGSPVCKRLAAAAHPTHVRLLARVHPNVGPEVHRRPERPAALGAGMGQAHMAPTAVCLTPTPRAGGRGDRDSRGRARRAATASAVDTGPCRCGHIHVHVCGEGGEGAWAVMLHACTAGI